MLLIFKAANQTNYTKEGITQLMPSSLNDNMNSWYGPVLSTRKENLVQTSYWISMISQLNLKEFEIWVKKWLTELSLQQL